MANLPNNYYSEEEWKKMLDNLRNIPIMKWDSADEEFPEFELDDDGVTPVGYKVLVHIPKETDWLLSPNLIYNSVWMNNQLKAHSTPNIYDFNGIHGTKTFDDLEPWWNEYRGKIPRTYFIHSPYIHSPYIKFVIVKIALWGVVVETEKGFRAEYAKIIEKILEE